MAVAYVTPINLQIVDNKDIPLKLQVPFEQSSHEFQFRPVVFWHGLGDNYNSSGFWRLKEILNETFPSIYVHSVYIDTNPSEDKRASYFGDSQKQVELVCEQLRNIPELENGFDALGFSQGGVLFRAAIEKCPYLNVGTFITFGSPNMGVLELPHCQDSKDWDCKMRNGIVRKYIWRDSIQKTIIPALFFRNPSEYTLYLEHSHLLADINNERPESFNESYVTNFRRLENYVMVNFEDETVIVPRESALFQDIDPISGDVIPFDETIVYKENLFGLQDLHTLGRIHYETFEGDHMQITNDDFVRLTKKYLGAIQ